MNGRSGLRKIVSRRYAVVLTAVNGFPEGGLDGMEMISLLRTWEERSRPRTLGGEQAKVCNRFCVEGEW